MKYLSFILFSCVLVSCNGQDATIENDSSSSSDMDTIKLVNGIPVFKVYGELAPANYIDDENAITEKYGFKVKRVAGCEVSQEEVDEIKRSNKRANESMKAKYGLNWLSNFEQETEYKLSFSL